MVLASSPATSDEMAELAALTGYDDEKVRNKAPASTALATLPEGAEVTSVEGDAKGDLEESSEALLDPEDLDVDDASPHRIWNSPYSKLIFVGLVLGIVALTVGAGVFGFQSQWANRQKDSIAKVIAPTEESPPDPALQMQSETGDLKTEAALSRQAAALDQTTDSVTAAPGTVTPGVATPGGATSTGTPGSSAGPSSSRPIQYSAPISAAGSTQYSAPTVSRSAPQYTSPVASRPVSSYSAGAASSSNEPRPDPYEQWQTASALGSYGEVSYSLPSSNSAQVAATDTTVTADLDATADKSSDYQQALYAADEAAILSGSPSQITTVTPGTTAAATLSTPIVWDQDLDKDQQTQRFGLQLTQPLLAADGSEALPAGAQMIAQVDTVSDSGLLQLSVQAVIEPTASGNRLVNIPPGAISIQGNGGNPLLAQDYHHDSGRIGHLNTQLGIIGALGKVGELLNRPSNTSTVSSPYISSTSTSNGQTNILGGLLEGGFGALQEQVVQQDQDEIEDILSRPNVWFVPAGQTLQVFTNSSFEVVAP